METFIYKQNEIKKLFTNYTTPEARYEKIIQLGRSASTFPSSQKIPSNLVSGCQSLLYLHTTLTDDGLLKFQVESDALISKGLAVLLTKIYNGEKPETILACPPTILDELGIYSALSPNRANGLQSLYLKMKQAAVKYII